MGTTRDAIRGGNPVLQFVLAIEGYEFLLTDGSTSAALTAWSNTIWSKALSGLQVTGNMSQSLTPWSNEIVVPRMTFTVVPDDSDQFGIDMFKLKPSVRSELTASFDSDADGGSGFSITVKEADQFAAATTVFIGNEAFLVSGTPAGNTIAVAANGAGYFSPLSNDVSSTNRFPGPHNIAADENVGVYEASTPVQVTDAPATWVGKKVALHIHKVSDGVLDTKAQSELWFAGTIASVTESKNGSTVLACDGIQQSIVDAIIMPDQWTGTMKPGRFFGAGQWVQVLYSSGGAASVLSTKFEVGVSAGFTEGVYTAEEFSSLLGNHIDEDAAIGDGGVSYNRRWECGVSQTDIGRRFRLRARHSSAEEAIIYLMTNNPSIFSFLGLTGIRSQGAQVIVKQDTVPANRNHDFFGTEEPLVIPSITQDQFDGTTIQFEQTSGSFFDHTTLLPPHAQEHVTSGEAWSFYSIGDTVIFLGRRDSDTQISGITTNIPLSKLAEEENGGIESLKGREESKLLVKQIFFATDTFANMISKLFASIDGNAINHATFDAFPFGAGIPWGILGSGFTDSLDALEQSAVEDSMAVIVERPTRLWDVVRSDFALRMAHPIWKEGALQIARLAVPNASTATFALDEQDKGDGKRTIVKHTSEFLVHTLKVELNRNPLTGSFRDHFIARDKTAYENTGGAGKTKTLKARNSYSGVSASGTAAEALAEMITSQFLVVFAKPMRTWTRSVNHQLFHMAPGDTVSLTDDWVRDPNTGRRGISVRAATVLRVANSFGISSGGNQTYFGELEVLFSEEDRAFPIAPSLEHLPITSGAYTLGWDAAGLSLLVQKNKFDTSGVDIDGFEASDAIRITEMDPADPASAASFTDVIVSKSVDAIVGGDEITLTTGFGNGGNPAFDGTKTYLVNYDAYDQTQAAQKLKSFQADDADGMILDLIDPNIVTDSLKVSTTAVDLTELPSRHSNEQFGDGEPLSASFIRDQGRMANNLLNYKTAPHSPMMLDATRTAVFAGSFQVVQSFIYLIGPTQWPGGRSRKLNIAPFTTGDGVQETTCRVTSSANPPATDSLIDVTWLGPKKQITFTTAISAAAAAKTVQELDIIVAERYEGFTWITVELSDDSIYKGLAEFWLGPLQ